MNESSQIPIRVMRVIARMNIGGPAVQVAGLMRGLDSKEFDHRLFTGFGAIDEKDYLDLVATDVSAMRIEGFGRRVSVRDDIKSLITLIKMIRQFRPDIIHTHTAKAGFLGRIASLVSFHKSIRIHTFHGHLLNGYFGPYKRKLVIIVERILAMVTDQLLSVGDKVRQDLLAEKIGTPEKFGLMPPGLEVICLRSEGESREFFGLSTTSIQCGYIGRVTEIKRPDRFLDVVSEIKSRQVNLQFFMAGGG